MKPVSTAAQPSTVGDKDVFVFGYAASGDLGSWFFLFDN